MRARLGQNFLADENWQKRIVDLFNPAGSFGEIGPGHGELTEHLLKKFGPGFTVFEMDDQLAAVHRSKGSQYETISGDFLAWDFSLNNQPIQNFSFVGNLPYESGTMIIKRMVEHAEQVSSFLFLLQKEVVERIGASPKSRDFGSLTVFVQGQFEIEMLDVLPPELFNPPPKVHSQLVRGSRRKVGNHPMDVRYWKFVQTSFLHKRKTFRSALKSQLSKEELDRLFLEFGWSPMIRAEEIPVDVWPEIYRRLKLNV